MNDILPRLAQLRTAFQSGEIDKRGYIEAMHGLHARLYEYAEFLRDSAITAIRIEAGRVIFEAANGVSIASTRPDQRSAPIEALNFGDYETHETDAMLDVIQDGDLIFDIGGNVGWNAILFAKRFPRSQVFTFEPVRPTFDELVASVALNDCQSISAHNIGLSDKDGEIEVFYDPSFSARSSARDLSDGQSMKLRCTMTTLDGFMDAHQPGRIDVIKCDVEGAELMVLKGGLGTIARDRPAIFAEMLRKWAGKFGYHPNDIIALLSPLDYVCYALDGPRPIPITAVDETTVATNFVFLQPDRHARWISKWGRPAR